MSRAKTLPLRSRHVPSALSDPDSPTSPSINPYPPLNDDVASDYETSAVDTTVPSAPHTLLNDDPFSTDTSKILFEAIGAFASHSTNAERSADQIKSDQLRKNGASKDLDLPQVRSSKYDREYHC
jgi:hypothetical protein